MINEKAKQYKYNIYILFIYTILTLMMTYPVAFKTGYLPGEGDVFWYSWAFWWFKKALIEHVNPFFTDYIFYPNGVKLIFGGMEPFVIILVPMQLVFGLITSYKIWILFSFVMAGYGTYLLIKYLTGDIQAAFISGLIFMFSPYHFARMLGHANLVSIEWIPFYVLSLIKTINENKNSNAIYAAFFLFLTAITSYYYLIYLLFFTLLIFLYYLRIDKQLILEKNTLQRICIMIIFFGVIFSPLAYILLTEILNSGTNYMYVGGSVFHSADLLGFFIPSQFHPVFKELFGPIYKNFTGGWAEYTVFAGYTVLFLALFAILKIKTKEIKFWVLSTVIFFILSLGPVLHINGVLNIPVEKGYSVLIPLPYLLLMRIPIVSITRVPSRWDVLVMLSLAVLAGYGLNYILKRFKGKFSNKISQKNALVIVFSSLILFEFLAVPFPMSSMKVPEFYYQLKNESEDYAIIEIPDINISHYMYYQTVHGKKLVNGQVARASTDVSTFIESNPFVRLLFRFHVPENRRLLNETIETLLNQNIIENGKSNLNYYNIRYIILHEEDLTNEQLNFVNNLLRKTLKTEPKIYKEDKLIVYKIEKD